jgi:hypothetical protein
MVDRKYLSSPPSVLDRHSQNAARFFYRWALIAAILHMVRKWRKRLLLYHRFRPPAYDTE